MPRTRRLPALAAAIGAAAALSGCGLFAEEQAETESAAVDDGAEATPQADEPEPVPDANADDEVGEADMGVELPPVQDVGLEQRDDEGVSLRVVRIAYEPSAIVMTVDAVNGSSVTVFLAAGDAAIQLEDDLGTSYALDRPEGNEELEIAPGETLEGELVFNGRLNSEAESLALFTNPEMPDISVEWPRLQFVGIPVDWDGSGVDYSGVSAPDVDGEVEEAAEGSGDADGPQSDVETGDADE